MNPNAIHLLEQNPQNIEFESQFLCFNSNAIHLVKSKYLKSSHNDIKFRHLFGNPSIFEIDYEAIQRRIEPFKESLIQKCFHPDRLRHYLNTYNYDIGDDEYQD